MNAMLSDGRTVYPLSGIKVIDFTQVMMGPCATQMLGDFGADVVKIEKIGDGDLSRTSIPGDPAGLQNPVFQSLNRNKRSIALDLRAQAGKDVVYKLVEAADVVVSNFRAGTMEKLGFGYEKLSAINSKLIVASGSGFGLKGPYAHKGGQDVLAQAMTGLMHRRSDMSGPLTVYPTTLADYTSGMHLVQSVLLALLHRERTGRGQQVEVALYNSVLAMQMQEASMMLMRDAYLNYGGFPLTGVFATEDSAVAIVGGTFKPNPLQLICRALEMEDLSRRPEFATFAKLVENRPAIQTLLRERFREGMTARWIKNLDAVDILCAPVRPLSEALADPQTAINKMLLSHGEGPDALRAVSSPVLMSDVEVEVRLPPPRVGEHSNAILAEIGYGQAKIEDLRRAGTLA
jgi:crotonobetainyl-CoA:carnitine CoA-transferase CaiB-like acyl-CoA transferase